jgi:hypothetical protein
VRSLQAKSIVLTNFIILALLYHSPFPDQSNPEPLLHPGGSIKLGQGPTEDDAPFIFTLNERQDEEFGFLKLFLSTEYVDFSNIEQPSPFKGARSIGRAEGLFTNIMTWDAVLVTIVLRRAWV